MPNLTPIENTGTIDRSDAEFFSAIKVPEGFKKAVGVVQIAMGDLGLLHRKLYNVAIANAYEGLGKGQRTFRMPISQVVKWANFESNDIRQIYDAFKTLRDTPVETIKFDKKLSKHDRPRKAVGATGLFAELEIIEGGILEYTYSENMAKVLHEPDQYIWMSLAVQNKFDSKYELTLYENCIRYLGVGTTGLKATGDWRQVLGAKEKTYDEFKYLNKYILKPAVKGINEKSGIIIEPKFVREKHKVAYIGFNVSENPQMQLLDYKEDAKIRGSKAYAKLRTMAVKDMEALYWIKTRGELYVKETIAYVETKAPKNVTAYLMSALREGYTEKTEEQRLLEQETQARAKYLETKRAEEERLKQLKAENEKRKQEFDAFCSERVKAKYEATSPALRKEMQEKYIAGLEGYLAEQYRKEGWANPIVMRQFLYSLREELLTEPEENSLDAYSAYIVA